MSGDTVALTGGVITGVASGVAALFGGYVCDWIDRRTAYCLFGVLIAVELVVAAHLPRSPAVWIGASVLYNALVAASYSAYSAVVLEVIGRARRRTKFQPDGLGGQCAGDLHADRRRDAARPPWDQRHVLRRGGAERGGGGHLRAGGAGLEAAKGLSCGPG